jgi:hypothetical protein
MPSPAGWPELPCVRCGRRTAGIDFGERCPDCTAELRARARILGSRSAVVATLAVALWAAFGVPSNPLARAYAWMAVLATYLIVRRIVERVAMEVLK